MFLYTSIIRLPPDLSAHLVSSDLASWKTQHRYLHHHPQAAERTETTVIDSKPDTTCGVDKTPIECVYKQNLYFTNLHQFAIHLTHSCLKGGA